MQAVGFTRSLPVSDPDSLVDIELPDPIPGDHDILVAVAAVSVNPADAKRRLLTAIERPHREPLILGFDGVGEVIAVGSAVTRFVVGDKVWYAGDATRPGSNASLQCVDARIAGRSPGTLTAAEAVAIPLTGLTAWEMLFERLRVDRDEDEALLVIGGAGGVGSVTVQIARQLTNLKVVATASRPDSEAWCRDMGAHVVIDHRNLVAAFRATGRDHARYIVQYADTAQHWDAMAELVAPQGRIGTIVETNQPVDITKLQRKSAALCWELMFTRSMFNTPDMGEQGRILDRLAAMVDAGQIRTTARTTLHGLSAATLREAHAKIETGATIGKIVIDFG